MRTSIGTISGLLATGCLLGCGTLIHGTSEQVGIASLPRGASVAVDDTQVGTTPVVVVLTRRRGHIVHLERPGYRPVTVVVARHTSGWWWGNLVGFPYLFAPYMLTDLVTGGKNSLSPDYVAVHLVQDSASLRVPAGAPGVPGPRPRTP